MKKTGKRNDKKASEKQVAKRKSVSWVAPETIKILERVNAGSVTPEAAANQLGTKPYYVGVRSGWLKQFGSAAEPADRSVAATAGKRKSTAAKKTKPKK